MRGGSKRGLVVCAVVVWLAGPAGLAAAQTGGRIEGTVIDESGGVLPGVTVAVAGKPGAATPLVRITDSSGTFQFVDLAPGQYTLTVSLTGFAEKRQTLLVRAGETIVQRYALALASFAQSVQVVAHAALVDASVATGEARVDERVLAAVPLAKEQVDDALPLLPSTIRGPDGLLNMGGTRANQSAFLVNGINGADPVTGQLAVRLPLEAVEALNVQAGIQSAEYGDATGGVTNVVTRPGQDTWDLQFQNFMPRLRIKEGGVRGIDAFTPRLRVSGPIERGRLWFAETVNYRFVRSHVRELESFGLDRSEQKFEGFDAMTQIDYALRPTFRLIGTFVAFPNNTDNAQLDTLHPFEATPDLLQRGWNAALTARAIVGGASTLETSFSVKQFNVETLPKNAEPSEIGVTGVGRNYFNHFDRDSRRYDGAAALTKSVADWAGAHLVKFGGSVARVEYDGIDASRGVLVTRATGAIARRIEFVGDPTVGATNSEVAGFIEDRWTAHSKVTIHGGARYAYEGISGDRTFAPRVELAFKPFSGDRTVVKTGYGRFSDKLPLNAKDFTRHQRRRVTLFDSAAQPIAGSIVDPENRVPSGGLQTPLSDVWNVELDELLTPNLTFRVGYQERQGTRELVVDPTDDALSLSSRGRSRSQSLEVTVRRRLRRSGQLNGSYVRARTEGTLNDFVSLFGTTRDPIIQPDESSLQPFDVPNRLLAWGVLNFPRGFTIAPTAEYRSGFPYTVVDELQQVVGSRNRGGRFPALFTLDLSATKVVPLTKKYRARVGVHLFNLTNHFNPRDVQNNVASPTFGQFANSVNHSVRVKFVVLF